ncbi:uncharacterized protein LOC131631433 [Vicia villosa]|uniref:uncharacterized protein LOC131631433 n=1 Tax=Vicia villosa TaxID=3911 RepID=UPI00273C68C1|nr:uncharacterized protein LOC131631433 [Vicia villosa]
MGTERRKTKRYTFKSPKIEELRKLGSLIANQESFCDKYGKFLYLLKTKIKEGILSTLVQSYDPLYHCSTFPNYQILPTLEEYASIIGLPITGKIPFTGLEGDTKSHDIAKFSHLRNDEIEKNMVTKGGLLGFPAQFMIEKALAFSKEERMDDFEAVFAMLVYGLFLFPDSENFVDINAIKVSMKGNHVPTLLGDTYYSIHLRNSYGKGMITFCTPFLYKWYISHFPNTNDFWDLQE